MYQVLLIIFVILAISLIALIMVQQNKNANAGISLSVSNSNNIFNSSNANNFITRVIIILAIIFFVISLILGNLSSENKRTNSHWNNLNMVNIQKSN